LINIKNKTPGAGPGVLAKLDAVQLRKDKLFALAADRLVERLH